MKYFVKKKNKKALKLKYNKLLRNKYFKWSEFLKILKTYEHFLEFFNIDKT